jgi:predicted RNase H-like HicB family nuclease
MNREFTAIIEKRGRWYIAYVEEIPGVNTQGRTLSETRENLKEALELLLTENRRLLPQKRSGTARRESITIAI